MNILFITEKYPPIICSGNRVYNLARYFEKKHKVSVLCRGNNRWLFPMPVDFEIPVLKKVQIYNFKIRDSLLLIPIMFLFKLKLISNSKYYYKSVLSEIKKNTEFFSNFDFVIASGPSWDVFRVAEYLKDKFKIPFILDYRDPWIPRSSKDLENQIRIVNKASKVITVTKYFVNQIKEITGYSKKIFVVENGVDLSFFQSVKVKPSNDNKFRIGYAGSFVNYQNVDILINVISKLPLEVKNKVVFEACGGQFTNKYKRLCNKLGVISNFYGHLDLFNMIKVLKNCDLLYIGHSIFNAAGGKFYTYLACGKPIICLTKSGSQLDIIFKRYKLGFVVYNSEQFVLKLEKIIRKRLDLDIFDKSYINNFDWSKLSKKYLKILAKIK